MSQPLPPKKEVALALLERSSVHVHLDPRATGVAVPPWFKRQPQLVLQIGLNMPVPIPDLRLDEEGMSCTLSFNRSPFFCNVPWTSVFAMVGDDGRGMVWPDDVPAEIAKPGAAREDAARTPAAEVNETPAPVLTSRKGGKRAQASGEEKTAPKAKKTTRAKRTRVPPAEPPRPVLVAVPSPVPAPVSMAERRAADAERRNAEAEKRIAEPEKQIAEERPRRAPPPSNKPKRELPPYLRVVK